MGQPCESSHTKDEDDNDELCPMAAVQQQLKSHMKQATPTPLSLRWQAGTKKVNN